jgi:regulatory protein
MMHIRKKPVEGDSPAKRVNGLSDDLTKNRIRRYCAYQERSTRDVEMKLREWKVSPSMIKTIVEGLKEEGFLDDARFVRAFIHGKFHINHWGKNKIVYELRGKGIPGSLIDAGMEEIDEERYREMLKSLIVKKSREIKGGKNLNIREKLINFALSKGFEFDLILQSLNNLKI